MVRFRRVKTTCWEEGHAKNTNALLAVMELHKPLEMLGGLGTYCKGCGRDPEYNEFVSKWPCATVEAIEKELAR